MEMIFLSEEMEILRLRILLSFLKEDETCTVMGISRTLGETKQTVSRIIIGLEKEGLADRSNLRHPVLTQKGREAALRYSERINISLNHLMYEGVNVESAKSDAYRWALYNTEDTMEVIRSCEKKNRAKYDLRDEKRFTGAMLCKKLQDGEYQLPFIIYREHVHNGTNVSMANRGFEHPCVLTVKNSIGTIHLRAIKLQELSPSTGKLIVGSVETLKYLENGNFIGAERSGDVFSLPISAVNFINIGEGIGQVLHGTLTLRMQCNVGQKHMPESAAIFTILI